MKTSISLLVPAYNEEATLERVVERCLRVLADCTDDYEVCILDDASRDRTAAIMEELQQRYPDRVRALRHETNGGIAATFEDLYRAATKNYIFLISADDEYPPEVLRDIVPMLREYDIVVCRRSSKPYTSWRHLVSGSFRVLPRLLFGVELYDPGSIKCMLRQIISECRVTSRGVFVEAERLIRAARRGYKIGVVDIVQQVRQAGKAQGARPALVTRAIIDLASLWVRLVILREQP